ncbi:MULTISPECIES: tyrosine-type recombinase/integrase, partial [unclassified Fusobacterium]
KTNAGKRTIPISSRILPIFKELYNTNNEYFFMVKGKKRSYTGFRLSFTTTLKKLNLEEHTIHDTRHTFASLLNNVNANRTSITKLIGHTDFNITENVYTHKDLEELRKAIDLLN